jgi:hypothetical protein
MDVCGVCCQVEDSATGWSLIQRSPTNWSVSLFVIQKCQEWDGPGLRLSVAPEENTDPYYLCFVTYF